MIVCNLCHENVVQRNLKELSNWCFSKIYKSRIRYFALAISIAEVFRFELLSLEEIVTDTEYNFSNNAVPWCISKYKTEFNCIFCAASYRW